MKRNIWIPLLAVLLLLLAGCSPSLKEHTETVPITEAAPPPQSLPGEDPTVPAETLAQVPPTTLPPVETQPTVPTITDGFALRDYLRSREEDGIREFSFYFHSTTVNISSQNIARVGGYFYVDARAEENLCHVQVVEYPGTRMVDAWKKGDVSSLTPAEQQALEIATEMVSQAKQRSTSALELEQLLFDRFRDHVRYHDGSTAIDDPMDPPRHLTAVGALVDGAANCQGYADGFYVLASLAGFTIDRMHVDIPDGGHTVNIICLDGAWYVVDTTFNDLDDASGVQVSYCLMNVGRDLCLRYSWSEDVERYPIADLTDHHFYYYQPDAQVSRTFASVDSMAQRIVDDWRVYGKDSFYLLLENQITGWEELGAALGALATSYGLNFDYSIWFEQNVEDTYFYVKLG